mmetsp:Transcript_103925/g.269064  ORF Transcript_103925/g.269064 Transcript_103925/m.269064 type:complete len:429 (+) Transcript_103925:5162-6448(+)
MGLRSRQRRRAVSALRRRRGRADSAHVRGRPRRRRFRGCASCRGGQGLSRSVARGLEGEGAAGDNSSHPCCGLPGRRGHGVCPPPVDGRHRCRVCAGSSRLARSNRPHARCPPQLGARGPVPPGGPAAEASADEGHVPGWADGGERVHGAGHLRRLFWWSAAVLCRLGDPPGCDIGALHHGQRWLAQCGRLLRLVSTGRQGLAPQRHTGDLPPSGSGEGLSQARLRGALGARPGRADPGEPEGMRAGVEAHVLHQRNHATRHRPRRALRPRLDLGPPRRRARAPGPRGRFRQRGRRGRWRQGAGGGAGGAGPPGLQCLALVRLPTAFRVLREHHDLDSARQKRCAGRLERHEWSDRERPRQQAAERAHAAMFAGARCTQRRWSRAGHRRRRGHRRALAAPCGLGGRRRAGVGRRGRREAQGCRAGAAG